jgi:hypothetical protein
MRRLREMPDATVRLLRTKLRRVEPVEANRLAKLVADLGARTLATRRAANKELARLGDVAEPALRGLLEQKPSLEQRVRIEGLLKTLEWPERDPGRLRALRAVEVLEQIGGPDAEALLGELAGGSAEARLTREARAARDRLTSTSAR